MDDETKNKLIYGCITIEKISKFISYDEHYDKHLKRVKKIADCILEDKLDDILKK